MGEREPCPTLVIRMLGRFEVSRGDVRIRREDWGRRKTETLLKILLTDPGHVFSQDQLLEWLFGGENPERNLRNLHGRVSELRRTLEPDLVRGVDSAHVIRRGQGYAFDPSSAWIDAIAFRDHLRVAGEYEEAEDYLAGATAIEEAIRLCRGECLEEDRYEEWALEAREAWREEYLCAFLRLADDYARLDDPHRAAIACREAFSMEPWRESTFRQLMRHHRDAGERTEALQAYDQGVEALKQYLGVGPSQETSALREEILRGDVGGRDRIRDRLRIAVLPLVNISPSTEDAYFADGITEELIFRLSTIREMRVIAQTSTLAYKGTTKTAADVGRELNVGSIIEGSVRKADSRVRVTVQLINTNTEEHLWAEEYDRSFRDMFAVQSEIAGAVADALQVRLLGATAEEDQGESTRSPESYELYLKGRHVMKSHHTEGLKRAIAYFRKALEIDPDYALAFAGLADAACCFWFFGNPSEEVLTDARNAADRAVELAPGLADGYAAKARIRWAVEKDLDGADELFRRAIRLAPGDPELRLWHAQLLNQRGRKGEGFVEILKAHEIDPVSASTHIRLAEAYRSLGLDEEAAQELDEALELDPTHLGARMKRFYALWSGYDWVGAEVEIRRIIEDLPSAPGPYLNYAEHLCALGRWGEARAALGRALELASRPLPIWVTESEGVLRYMLGEFEVARECLVASVDAQPQLRFSYWWLAVTHWMLGEYERALETLDEAEAKMEGFYKAHRAYMELCIEFARGAVYARMGKPDKVWEKIRRINAMPNDLSDRALAMAALHFYLGKIDEGAEWLEKAVEQREAGLRRFHCFDLHDVFRRESRVTDIFARTGLPPPVPPGERNAGLEPSRSVEA